MKKKYGHMACPDCTERVTVKINERGTLSYTCDECDSSGYCKQDQGNRQHWEKRITRAPGAGDPPPPPPKPGDPAPKPAPAPRKGFDL